MTITGGIAVYFVIWWTVLFAVLPFGVRSQSEGGAVSDGTDPGAPQAPLLAKKALATTVIAAIIFVGVWYLWSFVDV